ncbi:MAG: YfcC family protein [Acidobacteria bacterium]|nr:YfcC family protein [Acidobacteriota bacterium]
MSRLPHPVIVLMAGVVFAAVLTWWIPAGEFERRDDRVTGRVVVVPGTYHRVDAHPVGAFAALVAIPRGFVEAGDVVAVILFVGGAWVVLDSLGVLGRLVAAFAQRFRRRTLGAVPLVAGAFAAMGALENMQEEIIPLVPVLLLLGRRLGIDAVSVVGMSAGAAMIGSAFGPTNPFQAGIALQLAELPPLSGAGVRLAALLAATSLWTWWTMRYARRRRLAAVDDTGGVEMPATARDLSMLAVMLLPMAAYVYGASMLGWGFHELSAGFLAGGIAAGLVGGLGIGGTLNAYLEGMKTLLPAAVMVGVARSISLVLSDGLIIDTMLAGLSAPLGAWPPAVAAALMVPFHAALHVPVSSVSGHAVSSLPILVPLSDLVGVSRQVTVMAYQVGAGLTELLTPTNGSLMAILLAAGVPYSAWVRFAAGGTLLAAVVGAAAMVALS